MDIVLKPVTASGPTTWSLNDRLGRSLGRVCLTGGKYVIEPVANSSLSRASLRHETLSDAMSEIARHARGSCELSE